MEKLLIDVVVGSSWPCRYLLETKTGLFENAVRNARQLHARTYEGLLLFQISRSETFHAVSE